MKRASTSALPPAKKLHSFFAQPNGRPATTSIGDFHDATSPKTIVHYTYLDPLKSEPPDTPVEVVLYDLDGTLITPKGKNKFPKGSDDWRWWNDAVPGQLKRDIKAGKHVVILSNQAFRGPKIRREWREKLPLIAAKLGDVPLRVLAALEKDQYRKPRTGMFDFLVKLYSEKGWKIDMEKSIYVGDAAGRPTDHSNTDLTMALNAGLRFATPEEHFLGLKPVYPLPPVSWRPSDLKEVGTLPLVVPSNLPIARNRPEIVIFVGLPASGKTSFYRRHFATYEHVNQDKLKTRDRCIKAVRQHVSEGRGVVVDNTNRDKATRKLYLELAKELGVPIRVFYFSCPLELARHNNRYRAWYAPEGEDVRELLPDTAFFSYQDKFEKPSLTEGFDELRTVNFVWEGTEEQKLKWNQYL